MRDKAEYTVLVIELAYLPGTTTLVIATTTKKRNRSNRASQGSKVEIKRFPSTCFPVRLLLYLAGLTTEEARTCVNMERWLDQKV